MIIQALKSKEECQFEGHLYFQSSLGDPFKCKVPGLLKGCLFRYVSILAANFTPKLNKCAKIFIKWNVIFT